MYQRILKFLDATHHSALYCRRGCVIVVVAAAVVVLVVLCACSSQAFNEYAQGLWSSVFKSVAHGAYTKFPDVGNGLFRARLDQDLLLSFKVQGQSYRRLSIM